MRWTRKTTSRVRRERLPFPSVVPRAVSREGRVRARRREATRLGRGARAPRGSRAATPSRARGDRTPTPRGSTGFRTPTHARSPSPATRGRSPTPRAAASSPGRRFDPTAYVRAKKQRDEERFRNSARGIASGASTPRAAASPARERPGYGARGAGARGARSPSPAGRERRTARADIGADRRGGGESRAGASGREE